MLNSHKFLEILNFDLELMDIYKLSTCTTCFIINNLTYVSFFPSVYKGKTSTIFIHVILTETMNEYYMYTRGLELKKLHHDWDIVDNTILFSFIRPLHYIFLSIICFLINYINTTILQEN